MSKISRQVWHGKELQDSLNVGVQKVYEVAKAAYGPNSGNAILELNYGFPQISRDGVTNVRKVYLEDPIENMAARTIVQASEKSNKLVGDGTTAVVILAYHLYNEAIRLIGVGQNRMSVSRQLKKIANEVIDNIDKLKIDTSPELSRHVARVSASDDAIGDMIADVIENVGIEGNIIVEEFDGIGSYTENVDGFYFRKGFSNEFLINSITALESRMNDADILITAKPLKSAADINPILNEIIKVGGRGAEVLIIGDVQDEALATLALNKVKENIYPTLVDVPVHGPMRSLFLDDIAIYTGGKVFSPGSNSSVFTTAMLGGAKKVVINSYSTTILEGEGVEEDINSRVEDLRKQLKEAESLIDKEEIKKRLSALTGKIAIVRVGAPTETDRGEVQLRVEDAIAATQSAIRDGIVPGGGVCLARIAPQSFKEPFLAPFKELIDNAGFNTAEALMVLKQDNVWYGYDLNRDFQPTDLLKAGIIDPAEVVKEAVRNAVSVVSTLITATVGLTFVDRESKAD